MVAPFVRPLTVSTGTAAILVFIESTFLGALPTFALLATFVGPFVPLIVSPLSRRTVLSQQDANLVYEPLYEAIVKNRQQILSAKASGMLPMFQRQEIDQIRLGARYSLLRGQVPAVEDLVKSMDFIFNNQWAATRSASRIIGETIRGNQSILRYDGDGIGFRGKSKDGSDLNVDSSWIPSMLIHRLDPLSHYRQQGFDVYSMDITEKGNNIVGSVRLPDEEAKYRFLWDAVEKKAEADPDIKKARDALSKLPSLANEAEKQVLDKIKKSRSVFQ